MFEIISTPEIWTDSKLMFEKSRDPKMVFVLTFETESARGREGWRVGALAREKLGTYPGSTLFEPERVTPKQTDRKSRKSGTLPRLRAKTSAQTIVNRWGGSFERVNRKKLPE